MTNVNYNIEDEFGPMTVNDAKMNMYHSGDASSLFPMLTRNKADAVQIEGALKALTMKAKYELCEFFGGK